MILIMAAIKSGISRASQNIYHLGSRQLGAMSGPITLFYNDVYEVTLPPNHKFPMQKYRLVREILQREYSTNPNVFFAVSPQASLLELASTHCPRYVDRFLTGEMTEAENRRVGFPWSLSSVQRSTSSVGGTVSAMRTILESTAAGHNASAACHIAGGTHHAFYNRGEGFCVFSDIAVAATLALKEYDHLVKKVLIIDLDVHQGNGNAALFANNPNVFTFSVHCKGNYFSLIEKSDVDVEIDEGCQDDEYIQRIAQWVPYLMDFVKPQLIFFQAGVDIHQHDRLGKLSISRRGLIQRNKIVYEAAVARGIKMVVTMGGG